MDSKGEVIRTASMERILIIKLGAIGDVIHSLPVASTLRSRFPKSHLAWAVEERAAPVLEGNPDLDASILFERRRLAGLSAVSYMSEWVRSLRTERFDCVLDLHNLFKSGIMAYFSGAPLRVGFRKLREGNFIFMNRWIRPAPEHRHAVEKYLCLLGPLGVRESEWVLRFPLQWSHPDESRIDRFWSDSGLGPDEPVAAVNPGANWPSKRWGPLRYAEIADRLSKRHGIRPLILWGPGERPLAEAVAAAMTEKAVLAPETTLKQLMVLIGRCRMLIGGDSGPLHIASALGVPTVALFGPSDPARNGPYGNGHEIVRSDRPPAAHWEVKERGDRWMDAIAVDRVDEAVRKQIRRIGIQSRAATDGP
jgi:lipopolysaccharide heptosyltransferase II